VTLQEREAAKQYLIAVRNANPAPVDGWLAGRISTLLAHYWQDGDDVTTKTMVGIDWIEALEVFPQTAIEKACRWWRDNETRKPKPADIRRLTIEHFGTRKWEELMRVKKLTEAPIVNKARNDQPAEQKHDRTEGKYRVAQVMHDAGLPHDKEFCRGCGA
jgi:hypothetical protein